MLIPQTLASAVWPASAIRKAALNGDTLAAVATTLPRVRELGCRASYVRMETAMVRFIRDRVLWADQDSVRRLTTDDFLCEVAQCRYLNTPLVVQALRLPQVVRYL